MMKLVKLLILLVISLGLTAALAGCQSQNKGGGEAGDHREAAPAESGEYRESVEGVGELGEAGQAQAQAQAQEVETSGERFALNEIHDKYGKGIRLILAYDKESSAFKGIAENIIEETVYQVQVGVQLSNGVELGPTPSKDLKPGEYFEINLSAEGQTFTWWTPHTDTGQGSGEGSEGGEKIKK